MKEVNLPLTESVLDNFEAGEEVQLNGAMLVGRDQVHLRLTEALKKGEALPIDLKNEVIYYMGPSPTPEGAIIGSAGPTTAYRMDPFAPMLLDQGLKGMIGKGPRSQEVKEAIMKNHGVYLYAYGGCGALYAERIVSCEVIAYPELGPEAIYRIVVKDFPVVVAIDAKGNSIY